MTGSYKDVLRQLTHVLATEENFDVIRRDLIIGERPAALFFMDAFIKDETFEKIFEFLYKITPKEIKSIKTMDEFSLVKMPYVEVGTARL